MFHFTRLHALASSLVLLIGLISCGGGGGGGSSGSTTPSTPVTVFASKAPVTGGQCRLYNGSNQVLAGPTAANAGTVDFGLVSAVTVTSADVFYVECVGGTYLDEATGTMVTLGSLKAPAMLDSGGTVRKAIVTPLTHLAWLQSGGNISQMSAKAAQIATAFGISGVDILTTTPTDLNSTAANNNDAGKYGLALAAIAQYMKDKSVNLATALNNLNAAVTNGQMSQSSAQDMTNALSNLTSSSQNNNAAVRTNAGALATTIGDNVLANANVTVPKITTATQTMTTTMGNNLIAGGNGGRWTLDGTTLGAGFTVMLNGTACTSSGTVNGAGTQVTGVDCTNVSTSVGQTSATLGFTQPSLSASVAALNASLPASLSAAPAPSLSIALTVGGSSNTSAQRGTSQAVQANSVSNSSGAQTYSSGDTTVATIDASTGVIYVLDKTGTTTITVSQTAVVGQYSAATQNITLTVTDRTVPVGSVSGITGGAKAVMMGSAPYSAAASFTCSTESSYAPTISYASGNTAVATVSPAGEVTNLEAGSAVITATAAQTGTCASTQTSYALTVGKATPSLTFAPLMGTIPSDPMTLVVAGSRTRAASVTGITAYPAVTATLSYASSNPNVATVSNTGLVTAIASGSATITTTLTGSDSNYLLTSENAAITASYTVNVEDGVSVGGYITTYNPSGGDVSNLVLKINNGEEFTVVVGGSLQNGGAFSFPTKLATGSTYSVKVKTHATSKVCTVQSGTGTANTNVTSVTVECSFMPLIKVDSSGNDIHYSYWQSGSVNSWCAVKDPQTKLMWQNHVNAQSPVTHDLAGGAGTAIGYIAARNTNTDCGFTDWRLPSLIGTDTSGVSAVTDGTAEELETLARLKALSPTYYSIFFQNPEYNYWSSINRSSNSTYAWYQAFDTVQSAPYFAPRSANTEFFVRAVRTY